MPVPIFSTSMSTRIVEPGAGLVGENFIKVIEPSRLGCLIIQIPPYVAA